MQRSSQNLLRAIKEAVAAMDDTDLDVKLLPCVRYRKCLSTPNSSSSQLNNLEDFIRESDSQDLLFSLVNYRRLHPWLLSVGKYVAVLKACAHGRDQISSHLGLMWNDDVTQSILEDEKIVVQGVLDIIASGNVTVFELRGDDANSFLNLLQEVRKLGISQAQSLKHVVFGSFGTVPSLGGD
jgi:hypothetical protein